MKIRIHTQEGSLQTFVQDDPALTARILREIQPARTFAGKVITISGDYSLTTFATSRINRVDFITENSAPWKHPPDVLDVFELSEDEFRERTHLNEPARLKRRRIPKRTGDLDVCCAELEMAGGNRLFLAAKITVPLEAERHHRLRLLFSAPALLFRLRHGGHAILNLQNVVRSTIIPGPDVTPVDAWPAHHHSPHPGILENAELCG
jgi:hypothetical protein